jgi:hypothetical protein
MFNISNSDQTVRRTRGMLPSVRDDLGFAALIGFVNDFCKAENPAALDGGMLLRGSCMAWRGAPYVGSEAERAREVLTRFPNASQHGHQDAIDAARVYAAIAKTEEEALSSLLLFLGLACRIRQ